MNPYEIAEMAWDATGRMTDLGVPDGNDRLALTNGQAAVWAGAVNAALRALVAWRDPVSRTPFHLHSLEGEVLFSNTITTYTLLEDATASTINLGSAAYDGYVVDTGSEQKLLIYNGTDYDVMGGFTTVPVTGEEVSILKNWVTLAEMGTPDGYLEPLSVYDLSNQKRLTSPKSGERFISKVLNQSAPGMWYVFGNRIYFDTLLPEAYFFRVEYARTPTEVGLLDFAADAADIDLPATLHYAVVLWTTEWVYRRYGESNEKYSVKKDLIDFMRTMQSQRELGNSRRESKFVFKR